MAINIIITLSNVIENWCGFGWLFAKLSVGKRRVEVCVEICNCVFPQYSESQIDEILHRNLQSTGLAIIETGMAWFWSDKRIKKWCKIEGLRNIISSWQRWGYFCRRAFFNSRIGRQNCRH